MSVLLMLGFALAACSPPGGDAPDVDGAWQLVEGTSGGQAITPGAAAPVTLELDGDAVFGNSGCNTYRGTAAIDGAELSFGPLASTMMFCEDSMEVENAYLAALDAVTGAARAGDELTLTGEDVELVFERTGDASTS